jgi:hypothetical protein
MKLKDKIIVALSVFIFSGSIVYCQLNKSDITQSPCIIENSVK